jgi:hypothetical protein
MLIITLSLLFIIFLVSDAITLFVVFIEGVHWARDGIKCACNVDGCDASYITKYNLVQHL